MFCFYFWRLYLHLKNHKSGVHVWWWSCWKKCVRIGCLSREPGWRLFSGWTTNIHYACSCSSYKETGSTHSNKSGRNNWLLSSCGHCSRLLRTKNNKSNTENNSVVLSGGVLWGWRGGSRLEQMKTLQRGQRDEGQQVKIGKRRRGRGYFMRRMKGSLWLAAALRWRGERRWQSTQG